MFELTQAGDCSYYVNAPAKIGIYCSGNGQVCLIDSGNDKDAGRKLLRILEQRGWQLTGIVNTHSNADHIGGNHFIQQKTGCKIFAEGIEGHFTESPILEPAFLYGGFPAGALRHKFLMAQPSSVVPFSDPDFPSGLKVIPLPGHFFQMYGFRTPDDTVFLADCLSSAATLEKYHVSFIYDVAAYLDTLDAVARMEGHLFVPSHAEATDDIGPLVDLNRKKVRQIADLICTFCRTPASSEAVLKHVFDSYGLTMNFEQHVLVGSTVRSYLSWLHDSGELEAEFTDNTLRWKRR